MSNAKFKCLLFLGAAFLGCADIPDELRDEAKGDGTCGSSIYNPSTSFCYEGNVYAKCDGIKYNPTTQICQGIYVANAVCGGKGYNPLERNCCGSDIYNPSIDRCLNNAVETKCGTGGYYNASTQFCIGNIVYNKCNGNEYDPETKFCSDNAVYSKCGGSLYNPETQFCFSKDSKVYSLCGGKEYDPSSDECRGGVVQSKCGTGWYSSATQFCYDDKVYSLCGGERYYPETQGCQNGAVQGKCGTDWYSSATQFCSDDKIYSLCGGSRYDPYWRICQNGVVQYRCGTSGYNSETQFCYNNKVYSLCGGEWYNPDEQRCQSNVIETKCGSSWYNANTKYCSNGTTLKNYDVFVDSRDNRTYKIVAIGNQTWMAENLNYNVSGSKCYGEGGKVPKDGLVTTLSPAEIQANCTTYGRLYNWATAMDIDAKYNEVWYGGSDVKHKGICPSGWHLPSSDEWEELVDFADGEYIAVKKLKAKRGWTDCEYYSEIDRTCYYSYEYEVEGSGTDDFGFSALPGGYSYDSVWMYGTYFTHVGNSGIWWSASEIDSERYSDCAYSMGMHYGNGGYVDMTNGCNKVILQSVRCVKD